MTIAPLGQWLANWSRFNTHHPMAMPWREKTKIGWKFFLFLFWVKSRSTLNVLSIHHLVIIITIIRNF